MRRPVWSDGYNSQDHYIPSLPPSPPQPSNHSIQELGILKGQLSRWLLPFNTDTSVDEQQAATPRRFQESLLASSTTSGTGTGGGGSGGTLTEQEAEYLTAGARRVRQLVSDKARARDHFLMESTDGIVYVDVCPRPVVPHPSLHGAHTDFVGVVDRCVV